MKEWKNEFAKFTIKRQEGKCYTLEKAKVGIDDNCENGKGNLGFGGDTQYWDGRLGESFQRKLRKNQKEKTWLKNNHLIWFIVKSEMVKKVLQKNLQWWPTATLPT